MNRSEKIKQTAIKKYGSWEAFVEKRYKTPEAIEAQKRAASAGGKVSGNRPFKDPKKAREGYEKGIGKKHAEK